jgi:two-component system nitrogen regulation sensor histidine kinase NtrY
MEFIRSKLGEYNLDEISVYLDGQELFAYLSSGLPLKDYKGLNPEIVNRSKIGDLVNSLEPMGNGEMIRRGIPFYTPGLGTTLVVAGKFLPQNYAQRIKNITSYVERYQQLKTQKNPVKTFYFLTLIFITLLIIFAASWIGFQLAKAITVPIEKLAQATKEVSKGKLDVKVEDPASDEIGILIDSFNQMVSDLRESHHNIAQKTSELEARKQYIETILNNITTGVITLDAKGVVTTINPSARGMLGLTKEKIIGKNYRDVLQTPHYREIKRTIEFGIQNRYKLYDKEINLHSGPQSKTLALTLSPLLQSDSTFSGLIVVLDNLTQLIQAQKLAAWQEVAQRVAHEIKNPLTPIQLSAQRIKKNLGKSQKKNDVIIKAGANTIIREAITIKSLVDEFSNFARMPETQLQPMNIRIQHQLLFQSPLCYPDRS